jgi:hypothetical protein
VSILLTSRISSPLDERDFPEAYFCTSCGDYFGLAWVPANTPLSERHEEIAGPEGSVVFCPACGTQYPQYGKIPSMAGGSATMQIRDRWMLHHPPGARLRDGAVFVLNVLRAERMVLVISGDIPEALPRETFMAEILAGVGIRGLDRVREDDGLRVDLVLVDDVTDNTPAVTALLQTVYDGRRETFPVVMTSPIITLREPLRFAMLCIVGAPIRSLLERLRAWFTT